MRAVLRRWGVACGYGEILRIDSLELDTVVRKVCFQGSELKLPPKEIASLLARLMRNAGTPGRASSTRCGASASASARRRSCRTGASRWRRWATGRMASEVTASASLRSMTEGVGPRILFVEDEPSIAEPFSQALRRAGFETTTVGTAAGALATAARINPDLVLLDLTLPDGDGREVCRELRRQRDVPIVMLTARGTETDRVVGLELGADDYVVKPFSGVEVIARIRAVLRRARGGPGDRDALPEELHAGPLAVDVAARRVRLVGEELQLSRKELDLLVRLMRDAGKVVAREDLMTDVWDVNWFGSSKTLDVHVGWLRRKLGDDPASPRFIHTVRGVGFRFASDEELSV